MCDYWLDLDSEQGIIKKYLNKDNNRHKKYDALLPFITKTGQNTSYYTNFTGAVGAFSRYMSGIKTKYVIDYDSFHNEIRKRLDECNEEELKTLFEIIDSLYFEQGSVLPVNVRSLNFIESNTSQEQVAEFLYGIFVKPFDLDKLYKAMQDEEDTNILDKLVFDSLGYDNRKDAPSDVKADCYLPYVQSVFKQDFEALCSNPDTYKKYIFRFLAYYYVFYVTQLAVKFSKFEHCDRTEIEDIYMTLNWEVISRSRLGYKYGWRYVSDKLSHMYSHAVLLELISYNAENKHFDYLELFERFCNAPNDSSTANEIARLIEIYKDWIGPGVDFSKCTHDASKDGCCLTLNKVRFLYETIDYQFLNGSRKSHYKGFNDKFIEFAQRNFRRRRGQYGYTIGVNENDIIMFTQIILSENGGKVLITSLFEEFEKRGLKFDRDSKKKITELFEKMNFLDKKSDCGEAQYVKSVL